MKKFWEEMFTAHKEVTGAEDFADSVGLIIVMALLCLVFFI